MLWIIPPSISWRDERFNVGLTNPLKVRTANIFVSFHSTPDTRNSISLRKWTISQLPSVDEVFRIPGWNPFWSFTQIARCLPSITPQATHFRPFYQDFIWVSHSFQRPKRHTSQVLKLFICILKKLCIPIIKIIWTTKKMALWLNCILQPAEHLGPAFYSRFHCRPTQLPPSPTCKFFSVPASHTGRWERQARPTLSVALYSLMWKGVAQSFKLDPTSLHLTKLNS